MIRIAAWAGTALMLALSQAAFGGDLAAAQPAANGQGAELPPDFRGRITYQGNFSGRRSTPGRPPRRLDVGSIVRSATGGDRQEFAGATTIEVEYDGNVVRATYVADRQRGAFTGTRTGSTCRVVDSGDGGVGTFRCDRSGFSGTLENAPRARITYRTTIDAHATRFVDAAVEEQERRAAAAAAEERSRAQAAAAERAREAEAARVAAMPRATAAQTQLLADAIGQDSQSWAVNQYDVGSLTNVRVSTSGGVTTLRGDYTYNGGSRGWLEGRLAGGRIECIRYHDTGGCAPVRRAGYASSAGSGEVVETVTLSSHRWFQLDRGVDSQGNRVFAAVADIRSLGNGIVTVLDYFDSSGFSDGDGLLMRRRVDCNQFSIATVASGRRLVGDRISLVRRDAAPEFTNPGTNGRRNLDRICNRTGLTPISDVRAAAAAAVGR